MITNYERYRLYEILPGLTIWGTIIIGIALSFFKPLIMIYVIIVFDIYWVCRVVYFSYYLILSWRRFRLALKIDWMSKLKNECPSWVEKIQVVMLPIYDEDYEVVSDSLEAIKHSTYSAKKIYIVISGESRKLKHWIEIQSLVRSHFDGVFADLIFCTHPAGLAGEIPGKGSNINYAESEFKKYADARAWKYIDIIVSIFDIDTVVHPQYFSHLTYLYCVHPNPARSSFQPVTLYNNNLWESPSVLRVMAFGTTFWMLFSVARLDNMVTFSSHSMSFQAIVDCGGHARDVVSEDSRIFFQCWLTNHGNYEVTPLYIPVSMDTVRADNWFASLKNLYLQQRRWAWGTENIPFLMYAFRNHKEIPWLKKATILFHEWEGKWSWAVVAVLITILGRLPLWLANDEVRQSALFFNAPFVLENLMTIAMMGLLISAMMGMLLLPPRPTKQGQHKYLFMLLQWALVPVSLLLFSSVPCIDAVTHLMFGKYLGFNVSQKSRG
ncbi:MAG: hypothetical protein A2538_01020 [Candidatus Magasanikbacteria bacterium RIFOXYD2_FULL_41_14]|uniref:Glycosyltransferase 2-like domain-containing protein n=1 Tax=Candidatus Magasanikbacteria bacterium RIFOXYD2_FULL_41_14 TaxID=1798709 RepID=A0A1F6PDY9_9BACT|nr:MAG: hypothetical protein A2538_01020 [Candidatus Magasanikbacteria bacterium RIFOXYD2_FULL_41_14]